MRQIYVIFIAAIFLTACEGGSSSIGSSTTNSSSSSSSSGNSSSSSSSSSSAHSPVVIIFLEDHGLSDITAKPLIMPYLNSLLTTAHSKVFTNYTEADTTGPSLPDYIQISVGSRCGKRTNTITAGEITGAACGTATDTSVWNQLENAGVSWKVFMEGMPSACYSSAFYANTTLDTQYALIGNPAAVFASIFNNTALCQAHVLPYTSFNPNGETKRMVITK